MYIDPAAGSIVLQMLIAGALSALALVTKVRVAVVNFFRNIFSRRTER